MSGSEHRLREKVGLRRPTSSTAVAARTWNNSYGDDMRPYIVALILRIGLLGGVGLLFLFLWFGTGTEHSPVGLMIGITVAALAGLWWAELQIQRALEVATRDE